MAIFKPFQAIRPTAQTAAAVAALPYDVFTEAEARREVAKNPCSFLAIDRPETAFEPGTDPYNSKVYAYAGQKLKALCDTGMLVRDDVAGFYLYELTMDGRVQTGIVGCTAVDDYLNGIIKRHELTRHDKENDRVRHIEACGAHTGPIFLAMRPDEHLRAIENIVKEGVPTIDITSDDGIRHRVWVIDDPKQIDQIVFLFSQIDNLYIADGHHRAAAASRVAQKYREQMPEYTGEEPFNDFLAVVFMADELKIMDYNRVVKDLNGNDKKDFLEKIAADFIIEGIQKEPIRPMDKHTFGLYLEGDWYLLRAKEGTFDAENPMDALDVSILQNNLLTPILGIKDPRTDPRIDFVGGINGLDVLQIRAETDMHLAFSMFPTEMTEIMTIADANGLMPPKSTWFEPKLRSGLFIHPIN